MNAKPKAFGLWSAVFLGIGSMVGAGIFASFYWEKQVPLQAIWSGSPLFSEASSLC